METPESSLWVRNLLKPLAAHLAVHGNVDAFDLDPHIRLAHGPHTDDLMKWSGHREVEGSCESERLVSRAYISFALTQRGAILGCYVRLLNRLKKQLSPSGPLTQLLSKEHDERQSSRGEA